MGCLDDVKVEAWIPNKYIKEICPKEFHKFIALLEELSPKITRYEILEYLENGVTECVDYDINSELVDEQFEIFMASPIKSYYDELKKCFEDKASVPGLRIMDSSFDNYQMLDNEEEIPYALENPRALAFVTEVIDTFLLEGTFGRIYKYTY